LDWGRIAEKKEEEREEEEEVEGRKELRSMNGSKVIHSYSVCVA